MRLNRWTDGASALLVVLAIGCADPRGKPEPQAPAPAPLHLAPLADLAPAGGLVWIADLRPRAIFSEPSLIAPLAEVLPEADLDAMARARGGVDLRAADELVVAGYDGATVLFARQVVDPGKLETAFAERVADVQGRAVDRGGDDPRGIITRVWGGLGRTHETLVVFGREAAGLAIGGDAPLRAAELFAEQRLRRARPAWQAPPLDHIALLLGDAPLRAAAPGPFGGEWSRGVGGLLSAATGAGIAVRPDGDALRVDLVLTGAWGDRAAEAEERVRRSYAALVESGLGRLLGLAEPASPPVFSATPDRVTLEVRLRASPLLRGIGDATVTQLEAIMKRPLDAPR